MQRCACAILLFALVCPARSVAQSDPAFDAAAWRDDVRAIGRELPARHPNLFYRMTRAEWDSAVAATERRMPSLMRDEAVVALMELVALVHDGHTSVNPLFDPAFHVRYYPFELYQFEDGLFVRDAAPEYRTIVGAKVVRIGRVSAAEALAAAARIVSHENDWWTRAWGPMWLGVPELLDGLGLVNDMERLPLVVERDGHRDTVIVHPAGWLEPLGAHGMGGPIDHTGWVDMRVGTETPLWLRNPGVPYWVQYVPRDSTLYVCYRAVVSMNHPPSNVEFWRHVFALADSVPLGRLVLDIRENSGGNGFFNRQVVRGLIARPEIDRKDRLFVIMGRRTFSAAMDLVRSLEQWTNATFVGEPTGNATYFFGDHEQLKLPRSGLSVNVSTLAWPPHDSRDRRDFIAPAIYAPLTSAEYRAGVDPAVRAVLARGSTPPLVERVKAAVLRGDTLAAAQLIDDARRDVSNRFNSPEARVNTAGYDLLHDQQLTAALVVFRLNTHAFPQSANVWDSYGEALLTAGRREEAIAAYRRALEIDPDFPPSRQALARLGVGGP